MQSISKSFQALIRDEDFRNIYIRSFLDRFVYSSTDLEKDLTGESRKEAIENLLDAFNLVMELGNRKVSPFDLVDIGDAVNKSGGISGFRKINVSAGHLAEWTPVAPSKILYNLYSLLDNYYNVWCDLDVYEKEARLHINLMRIHPFEDGNKRSTKIILNGNLFKQGYPPVVITEGETNLYYKYINEENYAGFATFLKMKSLEELNTMASYYKIMKDIPISESIIDSIEQGGRK